jgi:phospholipid/cholesterol/gamma-HCH transport system substrate-binding protein
LNGRQLEIRVGGVACGLVALFAIGVVVFGTPEGLPPVGLQVDFPSAAGLKVGSKVCIAGVPVGEVTRLSAHDGAYEQDVDRRVYVRADVSIAAQQAARIGQDAVFTVTTEGVLGERYVEITPGELGAARLTGGLILPGVRSFQQKELAENAGTVGRIVGRLARKHSEPLSGFGADVQAIVRRSSEALDRTDAVMEVQAPKATLLGERGRVTQAAMSEFGDTFVVTMEGVNKAQPVEDLRQASGALARGGAVVEQDADQVIARLEGLRVAGSDLGDVVVAGSSAWMKAGASIPPDIRALRRLINSIETSLGALMRDREFLDDVLGMTKDVKRHPWKLLMRWE